MMVTGAKLAGTSAATTNRTSQVFARLHAVPAMNAGVRKWFDLRSDTQGEKVAGASCGIWRAYLVRSLRKACEMICETGALERIGLEPHIHLKRRTLKKPSWECLIGRRAR